MADKRTTNETRLRVASRRSKIAAMVLSGITNQFEIAQRLGLEPGPGQKMVSLDMKWIRNEWRLQAIEDWGDFVGQELARVDKLEKEAWEAWERSCKNRTSTKSRIKLGKRGDQNSSEEGEEVALQQRDGDPRFLVLVDNCIERRCKLLQLELKPGKDRGTLGPNTGEKPVDQSKISLEDFRRLPMEERLRILMRPSGN